MRLSFVLSLVLHGLVFFLLSFQWQSSSRMHLTGKVYSVRVIGSLRARTVTEMAGGQGGPQIARPKTAPAKAMRDRGPKTAVPKGREKSRRRAPEAGPARGAGDRTGEASGAGIAVDAAQFPFGYFLSAIERRVSDNWYAAGTPGRGLTCVVYFTLMRDGSVRDVRIEKGSGSEFFDRSAMRAVKGAAPFPPLPRGFQNDFLGIHFTFVETQ